MTVLEAKTILENGKAPDEMVQKLADLHGVDLFDAEMAMINEACEIACEIMSKYIEENHVD